MDTYFEQFTGDTRHFNVWRDNRIEALLKEAGCFLDDDGHVSYSMDRGIIHVASYVHSPDEMHKMLLSLPPKYGIYDISNGHSKQMEWGDRHVTNFIEFRTGICDRVRGEYDE